MSENLETLRAGTKAQIADIDQELSHLIAAKLTHGARAQSLGSQRAILVRSLHDVEEVIRQRKAAELRRATGD